MKSISRCLAMTAALLVTMAILQVDSWAKFYNYSGHACQVPHNNNQDYTRLAAYPFSNPSTTYTLDALCPITATSDEDIDISNVYVYYYDGNNNSSNGYVSCYVHVTNNSGTSYTSPTRYSCAASTTAGCLAADLNSTQSQWTGGGRLHWANPVNSGNSISDVWGSYTLYCNITTRDSGVDSYLRFYMIEQTEI